MVTPSCAYRRLNDVKFTVWHYLNTGSRQSVIKAKKSAAGRCIPEDEVIRTDRGLYCTLVRLSTNLTMVDKATFLQHGYKINRKQEIDSD